MNILCFFLKKKKLICFVTKKKKKDSGKKFSFKIRPISEYFIIAFFLSRYILLFSRSFLFYSTLFLSFSLFLYSPSPRFSHFTFSFALTFSFHYFLLYFALHHFLCSPSFLIHLLHSPTCSVDVPQH